MQQVVPATRSRKGWTALAMLAIVLLAFALRLYRLDGQSLWHDEAISVYYSVRDLPTLLDYLVNDDPPPLYFLVLHPWIALVGRSEFAVRFLSLWTGVAGVALIYAVGRQLLGGYARKGAPLAALVTAVSPWYVWYSQEARMYSLSLLLGLLSTYLFLQAWRTDRRGLWVAYALASAAGLYAHYYLGFLLAAQAGFALTASALQHRFRLLPRFLAAQLGVVLLFLPWTGILLWRASTSVTYWQGTMPITPFLRETALAIVVGNTLSGPPALVALAAALFLALVGLAAPEPHLPQSRPHPQPLPDTERGARGVEWWRLDKWSVSALEPLTPPSAETTPPPPPRHGEGGQTREPAAFSCPVAPHQGMDNFCKTQTIRAIPARLFLLIGLAVPVMVLYAVVAYHPKFGPRYLLPAVPVVYLILGRGVAALLEGLGGMGSPRFLRLAGSAAAGLAITTTLVVAARSLGNLYFDEQYARDDFRSVVRFVEDGAQPGDAVLLLGGHTQVLFDYYGSRGLDVYPLPDWLVPNLDRPLQAPAAVDALRAVAASHSRIWLVLWQDNLADPGQVVLHQLWSNSSETQLDRSFRTVGLRLYTLNPSPVFEVEPRIQHARSDSFADLVELRGFDTDRTIVQAGQVLAITLYWRAPSRLTEDLTAFVHLLNGANRVYAQIDRRPVSDFYTSSRWQPGQTVRDAYYLTVPAGTPPGQYVVEVGLYRTPSMERLRIVPSGAEQANLLSIQVVRGEGPVPDHEIQRPQRAALGPLELLGYDLERDTYRPGEELRLRLVWRARQETAQRYWVTAELVGERDRVVAQAASEPADGTYPTTMWIRGEAVRDLISLHLPPDTPDGSYRIRLGVRGQDDEAIPTIPLNATITIRR